MNEPLQTELTIIRYSEAALLCWFASVVGIIGVLIHVAYAPGFQGIAVGLVFGIVGLLSAGVGVLFAGRMISVEKRKFTLKPVNPDTDLSQDKKR